MLWPPPYVDHNIGKYQVILAIIIQKYIFLCSLLSWYKTCHKEKIKTYQLTYKQKLPNKIL